MENELRKTLESRHVEASAPCRIDMGGTLDIPIFYYPLRHRDPCTFNIALGLRTRVRLLPYSDGLIKISSRGFKDAAVALTAAFYALSDRRTGNDINRRLIAYLAYKIEETVAGVPCGSQDQLAAAYGGVHLWHWQDRFGRSHFRRQVAVQKKYHDELARRLLVAYCGKPHVSRDINSRWVQGFLAGKNRTAWYKIIHQTHQFAAALRDRRYGQAAVHMNRETTLRREMTPDVLDAVGVQLADSAMQTGCGARFTGAGGGGCIWALGEIENVDRLRPMWEETLSTRKEAHLLEAKIDTRGVVVH